MELKANWKVDVDYTLELVCPNKDCEQELDECDLLEDNEILGNHLSRNVSCPYCLEEFYLTIEG
jgi:hypothetical protein